MLRALSIRQPWASLIALGAKQWETRSWATLYRGRFAVHASRTFTPEERALLRLAAFRAVLDEVGLSQTTMPFGEVIALGTIADCVPTESLVVGSRPRRGQIVISHQEFAFGNFAPGRFAFRIENVLPLDPPVPAIGRLGLRELPADVVAEILLQLEEEIRAEVERV